MLIEVVDFNVLRNDSEKILSREEMKKIVGGLEAAPECKTNRCEVHMGPADNGDDGIFPGECSGDGHHCYCDIGSDVGTVNTGGVSHCTVGH